jgi:hypothetical protein
MSTMSVEHRLILSTIQWWKNRRPAMWTMEQYVASPVANIRDDSERAMAIEAAEFVMLHMTPCVLRCRSDGGTYYERINEWGSWRLTSRKELATVFPSAVAATAAAESTWTDFYTELRFHD